MSKIFHCNILPSYKNQIEHFCHNGFSSNLSLVISAVSFMAHQSYLALRIVLKCPIFKPTCFCSLLYYVHFTLNKSLCTWLSAHYTLHISLSTLHSEHYIHIHIITLRIMHSTFCILRSVICTLHSSHCNLRFGLCTLHSVYIVFCKLHSVHFTQHNCTLQILCCPLYIILCKLQSEHIALCTFYSTHWIYIIIYIIMERRVQKSVFSFVWLHYASPLSPF